MPNLTEKQAKVKAAVLKTLGKAISDTDTETAHARADDALCKLLIALGHADVVAAFNSVDKWYS
jgi:hypothetical protein